MAVLEFIAHLLWWLMFIPVAIVFILALIALTIGVYLSSTDDSKEGVD